MTHFTPSDFFRGTKGHDIRHLDFQPNAKVGDYMFGTDSIIVEDLGNHEGWDGEDRAKRAYHLVRVRPATAEEYAAAHQRTGSAR